MPRKRPHGMTEKAWREQRAFEASQQSFNQWLAEQEKEIALVTPACTCSKYPFPHVHNSGYARPWQRIPVPPAAEGESNRNLPDDGCYIHGSKARFWTRPDGSGCCAACHPNPQELSHEMD